ncbi:MAG: DUF2169 domain-containing protein, partial [Candidatus Cloacimonetes bacterium]|nr:DUF2169 domain-containing protein [Candidatus Cloacimonadota bacterium]
MLQLRDRSPFESALFNLPDPRGVDTLIVVIAATFTLDERPAIAIEQRPIALADVYEGDPTASSLRYPTAVHLAKPGTDVCLLGDACAPGERPIPELDVALGVADRLVRARVYGDRYWTQGLRHVQPSAPQLFTRVPVTWERAYGGGHGALVEARNPVGVGFLGSRQVHELLGQPVPNVDDPDDPLRWLGQAPRPIGVAPIAATWAPRVGFAGTYDDAWQREQAPFLPADFDPRFHCVAVERLHFDAPLVGGEPVVLDGFDPARRWHLRLPRCVLDVDATIAGSRQRLRPILDTVLLEPRA